MLTVNFAVKICVLALVLNIALAHDFGFGGGRGRGHSLIRPHRGPLECPVNESLTNCSVTCDASNKRACGYNQRCCPSSCGSTVCANGCSLFCPFGFSDDSSLDEAGCRNSTCNPNPCEAVTCGAGEACELKCANANEEPKRCTSWQTLCSCKRIKCERRSACKSGFEYQTDATTGCQVSCNCVQNA